MPNGLDTTRHRCAQINCSKQRLCGTAWSFDKYHNCEVTQEVCQCVHGVHCSRRGIPHHEYRKILKVETKLYNIYRIDYMHAISDGLLKIHKMLSFARLHKEGILS